MKNHRRIFLAISAMITLKGAYAQSEIQKLRILTENWPPVSFEENGKAKGMAVELVEAIQKHLGSSAVIEVVPWARGYRLLQDSPNTLLFTLIRNPEREKMFTMLGPVAQGNISLFTLSKNSAKYASIPVVKDNATVAVTRGTAFESYVQKQNYRNILQVRDTEMGLRLLVGGRVNTLCDDSMTVRNLVQQLKLKSSDIKTIAVLKEYNLYLGFSPGTDVNTLLTWKKELELVKHDGEYEQIYRHWFNEPKLKPSKTVEFVGNVPLNRSSGDAFKLIK